MTSCCASLDQESVSTNKLANTANTTPHSSLEMFNATDQRSKMSLYHLHCLQVAQRYLKSHGADTFIISKVGQFISSIQDDVVQQYHLERIEDIDKVFDKFNDICEQAMISLIDATKHARGDDDLRRSSMSTCCSFSMTTIDDATTSSIVTMSNGDSQTLQRDDESMADNSSKDCTNLSTTSTINSVLDVSSTCVYDGQDETDLDLNHSSEDVAILLSDDGSTPLSDGKLAKAPVSQSQLSIFDDICSDLFKELRATSSASKKAVVQSPAASSPLLSLPDSADANAMSTPMPLPTSTAAIAPASDLSQKQRTDMPAQSNADVVTPDDHCDNATSQHKTSIYSVQIEERPIQMLKRPPSKPIETISTSKADIGTLIDFGDDEPSNSIKQGTQSVLESPSDSFKSPGDCKAIVTRSQSTDIAVVDAPSNAAVVVAQTKPQTLKDWRYGRGDIDRAPISIFWNYALEIEDDMEENGVEVEDTQLMVVI